MVNQPAVSSSHFKRSASLTEATNKTPSDTCRKGLYSKLHNENYLRTHTHTRIKNILSNAKSPHETVALTSEEKQRARRQYERRHQREKMRCCPHRARANADAAALQIPPVLEVVAICVLHDHPLTGSDRFIAMLHQNKTHGVVDGDCGENR